MLKGKRKLGLILATIITLVLAACGGTITKQEDVMKELGKILEEIENYHLEAEMVVDHDGLAQTYYVEVWYQQPELYKVALKNDSREVSQIIIKNNEGVHVVNPYMNKVFKFSKDWPHAQGQLYLYQTLLNNITKADSLDYEYKDEAYYFTYEVENGQYIAKQEVVLEEGFYPKTAMMTDEAETVKITVNFENFEANIAISELEFDVDEQLKSSVTEGMDATAAMAQLQENWTPMQPEYVPAGMTMTSLSVLKEGDMEYAVLQYAGADSNFTIIQKPDITFDTIARADGELVEIYGTVAILSGGATPTLQWHDNGIEFTLSGNLSMAEMQKVAATVYRPAMK
ncbi:outer membrane lipoprotein-sorting protein [Desulfuribacillus alkaliarsenatis]|uniref:DUF4367 domain-containing protein n=1 Tax=Desulfuribacillus alkaliarsenatis TaxID=766136 RepID=A0A1E5FZ67_9FIRM|nr:DUF4367 domain-containing protein [Desulfuribacillus alkaliarsenatis]OEF95876.1 hypothetical protein BHF68_10805 [Desulfuribacillus alkaliarsenatis]